MADVEEHQDTQARERERAAMRRALTLAEAGLGLAAPNPLVGAVVLSPDGTVVGEGWHEGPGTDHAEVVALRAAGARAAGATVVVTLEPCSHHGRTPPCALALREAGVARVVAAVRDPNPLVDGRGLAMLAEAGIETSTGVLAEEAEQLNEGFLTFMRRGLPFVTLKTASSLDGRAAARDGSSRWITGPEARRDVHRLRASAGAVVVGAGTALADDPALTVRLDGYRGRQPLRVVLDSTGRTPATGRLFDGAASTLMATAAAPVEARRAWAAAGAEVWDLPPDDGGVSLAALVKGLGERRIHHVLIEGGPTLAWSALRDGLVDRWIAYVAPKAIGGAGAPSAVAGVGVARIEEAIGLEFERVERIGDDLKVVARVHGNR